MEDHSNPLVSAVWSVHVGDSAEPPDFAGNSHYLEHLMATAGEKREAALAAIHREIKKLQDGLAAEELDRVKVSYLASMNRYDRTAARRTVRQAGWWIKGHPAGRIVEIAIKGQN